MKTPLRFGVILLVIGLLSVAPAETLHVYFGNLHSHTSYSDGSGFPVEAFRYAREQGHLDFMAITEHNHAAAEGRHKAGKPYDRPGTRKDGILIANDHALYNGNNDTSVIGAAKKATVDGEFVALYGQEFSTISSGNHVNVFEIGEVIPTMNGQFDRLLTWLGTHKDSQGEFPIIQFNHPVSESSDAADVEYGRDDFGDEATWIKEMGAHVKTIEVLCGPGTLEKADGPTHYEKQYWDFLNMGFRVAPTGDQDNHYKTWGTLTNARTAVVCPALTRKDVIEAIRSRHVYATDDPSLKIIARVNGSLCGEEVGRPTGDIDVLLEISNADDPNADYLIAVYGDKIGGPDAKIVAKKRAHGDGALAFTLPNRGYDYIALKVTHEDEDENATHAWLAPVWFK